MRMKKMIPTVGESVRVKKRDTDMSSVGCFSIIRCSVLLLFVHALPCVREHAQ